MGEEQQDSYKGTQRAGPKVVGVAQRTHRKGKGHLSCQAEAMGTHWLSSARLGHRRVTTSLGPACHLLHRSTVGSVMGSVLQEIGVEPCSGIAQGQKVLRIGEEAGGKCHRSLVGASLAWGSPFHALALARLAESSPSCPWQGPSAVAASVHLMKPSGCDTISSKRGREPLPVPVREGGRVPINKTILEGRRKSPFCSHPPCFPTLYFYKRAGPRPTAFTQRSQLHIVAAGRCIGVGSTPHAGPRAGGSLQQPHSPGNELSTGGWVLSNKTHPDPHAGPHPPTGEKTQQRHCKEQAWRPQASDTGPLCAGAWPLPQRAQPLPQKGKQGGGHCCSSKVVRWTHRHILLQRSQEEGRAANQREVEGRWRVGFLPLPRPSLSPGLRTRGQGSMFGWELPEVHSCPGGTPATRT